MQKKAEWTTNEFGHIYTGKRLYYGKTPFQTMEIFKNKTFGTILFLDGKIQISERDENRYHQYLVDAPLLAHNNPKSICIVGGGDCFALEEAIKHSSLKRILMVEIDKGVVDFCLKHYPVIKKVLKDKRVEIVYLDARKYLEDNPEKFDVIVIDLTEPHGPSKMLYTKEFYKLTTQRLNKNGVLSIHTDNYVIFPESYSTIYKTLKSVYPYILTARIDMPCFAMGWTYRIASKKPISYNRIYKNLKSLNHKGYILDQFTPTSYLIKATPEEIKIIEKFGRVSTDKNPFDKFKKLKKYVLDKSS
ncbi:MAG: spermidine synthase [Candidatus Firestonebacteria bacterium]